MYININIRKEKTQTHIELRLFSTDQIRMKSTLISFVNRIRANLCEFLWIRFMLRIAYGFGKPVAAMDFWIISIHTQSP